MTMTQTRLAAAGTLLAALALALMAAPPAAAHEDGNHGTIKVHDDAVVDPAMRNQPHVSCDFWIEGFNMDDESGHLVFYGWPPTGDKSVVMTANWTADSTEGDGSHFLAGPFTLATGHYRVEAFLDEGHPGNTDHFSKTKTFWVDDCQPEVPPTFECPTGLSAQAQADGSILVSFTEAAASGGTNLYRAEGTGELEYVTTIAAGGSSYLDTDTTPGTTYTYSVTALFGDQESTGCQTVEASAIPEFPTPVALGIAGIAGLGAYAAWSRRKK